AVPGVNPEFLQKSSHVGAFWPRAVPKPIRLSRPPPSQPSACRRERPEATTLANVSRRLTMVAPFFGIHRGALKAGGYGAGAAGAGGGPARLGGAGRVSPAWS